MREAERSGAPGAGRAPRETAGSRLTIGKRPDGRRRIAVESRLLPPLFGVVFALSLFFLLHAFFDDFTGYRAAPFSDGFGGSDSRNGGHFVARPIGFGTTPYFTTMLCACWVQAFLVVVLGSQRVVIELDPRSEWISVAREVGPVLQTWRRAPVRALSLVVERKRRTLLDYGGHSVMLRYLELWPSGSFLPLRFGQGLANREFDALVSTLERVLPPADPERRQRAVTASRVRTGRFEAAVVSLGVAPIAIASSVALVGAWRAPGPPPLPPPPIVQAELAIAGRWQGIVDDARVGSYTAVLTLYNALPDTESGSVRYSPFPCRTTLEFQRADGSAYVFGQRHRSGQCLGSEPTVSLARSADGKLRWVSYDADAGRRSSGLLERL